MKKFLLMLCLCLSLALILPSVALAASTDESNESQNTAQDDMTEHADTPPAQDNAFLVLYDQIRLHLPEVFSALSMLSACILAFCYKRGLLPILRDGIGTIGSATQEWKNAAELYAKDTKEICENANNSIQNMTSDIEKMQNSILSVEQQLDALGDQKTESEVFREILRGQVDMLYDIFLSSSLPQFEKDRVGKRVEEMRKALEQKTIGGEIHAEE